jgi:hypothetical protein
MPMNMHTLRGYKNRYCNQCSQECGNCRVKGFIGFVGLQETPHGEFGGLMKTNMPTDLEHRQNKFTQKHGKVIK